MANVAQSSFPRFTSIDGGPLLGQPNSSEDVEMTTEESSDRLIIAVDFGTTFSSVAYSKLNEAIPEILFGLNNVKCITNYPDDRPGQQITFAWEPRQDVPTELWYHIKTQSGKRRTGKIGTTSAVEQPENGDPSDSDSSDGIPKSLSENESEDETEPLERDRERRNPENLIWGYGVQKEFRRIDIEKDGTKRVARFKLMLDEKNSKTNDIRDELKPILGNLKRSKLIQENTDIISDYLTELFTHTKRQLESSTSFNGGMPIEFVLCVPAIWPSKACRIMQRAMAAAVQRSGLGGLENESLSNLFIVSEPEAAAACVLAEHNNDINPGETIVILDAGGGTVDGATYEVTNSLPLRLSAEVVVPSTKLCGASYINERFAKLLKKKLKHEGYLEKNGKSIQSIVEGKVMDFENVGKRIIDVTKKSNDVETVWIDDLLPNSKKRFYQNGLELSRKEMKWVFEESLDGAAAVLREQLEMAKAKGNTVEKVLLIGGFGQSPSLRSHLRSIVSAETNFRGRHIDFLTPLISSTAVARGAVLRAYNKADGPSRVTSCSYGFLLTEPYEPDVFDAHRGVRCTIDKADGERYVDKTIRWLIKKLEEAYADIMLPKDDKLSANEEFKITVKHTFAIHRRKLICKEELYVSDDFHEDHYRKGHAMNNGAELAGTIEADMTFLRAQGLIQPELPSVFSTNRGSDVPYWAVSFDLVMIVDGRNLRYEARWPPSKEGEETSQDQVVHARGQTCIAAAFKPGTS